jgi:hypothetical protein
MPRQIVRRAPDGRLYRADAPVPQPSKPEPEPKTKPDGRVGRAGRGRTALDDDEVRDIRRLYAEGTWSFKELGDIYRVSWATARQAVVGYKHVTNEPEQES